MVVYSPIHFARIARGSQVARAVVISVLTFILLPIATGSRTPRIGTKQTTDVTMKAAEQPSGASETCDEDGGKCNRISHRRSITVSYNYVVP